MYETVAKIISEQLGINPNIIDGNSRIVEDLGADSLDIVEILMTVEERFGIDIPDEDLDEISTVNDAVEYIENCV